jgi:hypothetical protein
MLEMTHICPFKMQAFKFVEINTSVSSPPNLPNRLDVFWVTGDGQESLGKKNRNVLSSKIPAIR